MPLPKVVIINDSSRARGGATSLAILSAKMLVARGYDVTFVAADQGDDGELESFGIKTRILGGKKINEQSRLKSARDGMYNRDAARELTQFIRDNDDDNTVYHLHVWAQILSPAVFDVLGEVADRTYIHAHDFFLACPNGALFNFRSKSSCTLKPASAKCLATHCDKRAYAHKLWRSARYQSLKTHFGKDKAWAGVISLHPEMDDRLERGGLTNTKPTAIRNPAVPVSQSRIRAEENDVFCYVGRIEAGKGVETLCNAARQAGVKLRVIGAVGADSSIKDRYPEVEFTGWLNREDIGQHLQDARALVMPSEFAEPFGLVAAEASASGLPVVVSNTSMISKDVRDDTLGLTTDVSTPEVLAASLTEMAHMAPSRVKAISERAFKGDKAIGNTPDAWLDALCGLYAKAVSGKAKV